MKEKAVREALEKYNFGYYLTREEIDEVIDRLDEAELIERKFNVIIPDKNGKMIYSRAGGWVLHVIDFDYNKERYTFTSKELQEHPVLNQFDKFYKEVEE